MKSKKLWAMMLSASMIVSSIGVVPVAADTATTSEPEVVLSVTPDKTDVAPGDTVTLTVAVDKFQSSREDDVDTKKGGKTYKGKCFSTFQCMLSLGEATFEEEYPELGDFLLNATMSPAYDAANNVIGIAEASPNNYIEQTETPVLVYQATVTIPGTITKNQDITFEFVGDTIAKNFNAEGNYTVETKSATVHVWAEAPEILVDGVAPVENYTKGVNVDARGADSVTLNGQDITSSLPYYVADEGTYTVVATGKAGTAKTAFTVTSVLESIEINTLPKTTYKLGKDLDLTGGVIDAKYSLGNTKDISMTDPTVTVSGYDSKTVGKQTLTVCYSPFCEYTNSHPATIGAPFSANTGDETIEGDFKATYTFHDKSVGTDNFDNYILEINNGDGTFIDARADAYGWLYQATDGETITFANGSLDWPTWNAAMKEGQDCTVTVERKGTTFNISLTAAGETFTATTTVAKFEGKPAILHLTGEECELTNVKLVVSSENAGKTTTFEVEVLDKEVTDVVLKSQPVNTTVKEGKDLDLTGATIDVTYDDGSKDEGVAVTEDMVSGFDNTKLGEQELPVTYKGKTAQDKIYVVVEPKAVTGIVVNDDVLSSAKEGKEFAKKGTITVSYDNDTTEKVNLTADSVSVDSSAVDMSKPGEYTVKVTYTDNNQKTFEGSYKFTVEKKVLTGITMANMPSKTSIIEGLSFDFSDGTILATYDNDTTADINITNDMVSGYDNKKVGTQTATVTYTEDGVTKTDTFEVIVTAKSIETVEVKNYPTADSVMEGKQFDPAGGVLVVSYNNETSEEVEVTDAMITLDTTTPGMKQATITYDKYTFPFDVLVIAKKEISITPNKTEFEVNEGTELPATDLVVSLNYDNDTSVALKYSDLTVEGYDMNKLGEQKVVISYSSFTTEITVTVLAVSDIDATDDDDSVYAVVKEDTTTKVDEAVAAVGVKANKTVVYDVATLSKKLGTVVDTTAANITVAVPEGLDASKLAVYLFDGTSLKELAATIADGKVTFANVGEQKIVFVEKAVEETKTTDTTATTAKTDTAKADTTKKAATTPKTGDSAMVIFFTLFALAGASTVVVARRRVQR